MTWLKRWDVPSDSSDKVWVVAISDKGTYGCSCPAWTFQRKKINGVRKECKHIKRIKFQEEVTPKYGNVKAQPMQQTVVVKRELKASVFIQSQPVVGRLFTFDD